jgi:hypothetical protein
MLSLSWTYLEEFSSLCRALHCSMCLRDAADVCVCIFSLVAAFSLIKSAFFHLFEDSQELKFFSWDFNIFFCFFWWCWGLNPGPFACEAITPPLSYILSFLLLLHKICAFLFLKTYVSLCNGSPGQFCPIGYWLGSLSQVCSARSWSGTGTTSSAWAGVGWKGEEL